MQLQISGVFRGITKKDGVYIRYDLFDLIKKESVGYVDITIAKDVLDNKNLVDILLAFEEKIRTMNIEDMTHLQRENNIIYLDSVTGKEVTRVLEWNIQYD